MDNTYLIVFVAVLEWAVCARIYWVCIVIPDLPEPEDEPLVDTAVYLGGGVYDWGTIKSKQNENI